MNFVKTLISISLLSLIPGFESLLCSEYDYEKGGPRCYFDLKKEDYQCLGENQGVLAINQTLPLSKNKTMICYAKYPFDLEMTGVSTQLMTENLRSQYSLDGIYYTIATFINNLLAPRRFTFYKLGNRSVNTTLFVIRSGEIAFPNKGPRVNVKSDREILTLPCIVSDPNPTKMSLKLKKLVREKKYEDSNQTSISSISGGKLVRTTKQQINTIVEDEFPWDGQFLRYDKTQGFLLNITYFGNPSGDFSCIYTHPNSNTEERFPITILPPRDHEVEPELDEVIVFQNGKLHLSCRSKEEVILLGYFNGSYINISSTRSTYRTHLHFQAFFTQESTDIGNSGNISCVLKANRTKIIHTWSILSLDMWNNNKLNLSVESKNIHCKSSEAAPQLTYILCSSEGNCRHRIPCFLPGNSCPNSERVKYGSICGSDNESCIEFSAEERFSQGMIGCRSGSITAWTYFIKAFDDKIYTNWRSAPASALIEVIAPKERLFGGGKFSFLCRFSSFISNGEVKWYYRLKNTQILHPFAKVDGKEHLASSSRGILKLALNMTHIVCSIAQWDAKAFWNVSEKVNVERRELPTEKNLGYGKKPIFVKGQTSRSISCAAHGLPPPKIEWFKQGSVLPGEFEQIKTNNEDNTVELKFPPIKQEHAGVYLCNATNYVGFLIQNFTVEVRDKKQPYFANETVNYEVFTGDNAQIECKVESYPRPIIRWTQSGTMSSSVQNAIYAEIGLETISSIRLNTISENHEGIYKCIATNEFGTAWQNHVVVTKNRSSSVVVLAIIILASIAIAALIIPLLFITWRLTIAKKEIRDLTVAEVDEFFNGNWKDAERQTKNCSEDSLESQSCLFTSLPYNKEFEIRRDTLTIDDSERLGEGAFGTVSRASIKGRHGPVAVKTVKSNSEVSYFKALLSELKIMIYIGKHPNVVTLIGAYTENIKKRELYIAVELCQHGSLEKYLQGISQKQIFKDEIINDDNVKIFNVNNCQTDPDLLMRKRVEDGSKVSTSDLIRWSYQIASGMNYLAIKKVVHSDLSTRNVLLHEDGTIRITDFGLSRQLYDYTQYVKKNQAPLPWRWMAIESLRNMCFSTQSDVWAFGVTMWEIFSLADIPYPGRSWTIDFVDELCHGLRMKKPRYATSHIYSIMYDCWKEDPIDRPSFSELKTLLLLVAFGEKSNILLAIA